MPIQPGFYGILSEPRVGYVELAAIMVAEGVKTIQLRMKGASRTETLAVARRVRAVVPSGHLLIVNDFPEVARDAGADGVHLGQGDAGIEHARRVLPAGAVIGLSTHSVRQVREAGALGPSYIGVGPVFATATKSDAEPTIGLEGLARMCAAATVPTVAIGGIGRGHVGQILAAGAQGFCVVGSVNSAEDPTASIRELVSLSKGP